MKHGAYYQGRCRNATIARWNGEKQCFVHFRTKFGEHFLESIKHEEDFSGFDCFKPDREVTFEETGLDQEININSAWGPF
ncbi:hypothetical protein RALTA_B0977 [Cupriavidus taiwanensis LMG 19424]|uniref:Uncharacterized protein n=2 Tax=Cupriavidus taiwanensis TaxID=164546 RepID=B3R9L3_CUPTR|nr:hypothetical protein RALTA_B0977 [Cupriavidus taiwanensis LMG 19424]